MLNRLNNFSDYRIFGQDYGMCGQVCAIVAYAILNNLKLDRKEFLKLENQINDIVLKDKRRPLSHSDFISIAELFNMSYLEESLLDLKNKNSNSLSYTRLKWREFHNELSGNLYYDDEHYVLIYKIENNIVYFWEPSFLGVDLNPLMQISMKDLENGNQEISIQEEKEKVLVML